VEFSLSDVSEMYHLQIHIQSDTYIGFDWKSDTTLSVFPRNDMRLKKYHSDEDEALSSVSQKIASKLRKKVAVSYEMEKMIKSYNAKKRLKKAAYKVALSGECDDVSNAIAITENADQSHIEKQAELCSKNEITSKDEIITLENLLFQEKSPLISKNKSTELPNDINRQETMSTFVLWKRSYFTQESLLEGLDKFIPDTLRISEWMEAGSCDPSDDCISFSDKS
jgi:hypothetical protein